MFNTTRRRPSQSSTGALLMGSYGFLKFRFFASSKALLINPGSLSGFGGLVERRSLFRPSFNNMIADAVWGGFRNGT